MLFALRAGLFYIRGMRGQGYKFITDDTIDAMQRLMGEVPTPRAVVRLEAYEQRNWDTYARDARNCPCNTCPIRRGCRHACFKFTRYCFTGKC